MFDRLEIGDSMHSATIISCRTCLASPSSKIRANTVTILRGTRRILTSSKIGLKVCK